MISANEIESAIRRLMIFHWIKAATNVAYYFNGILALESILRKRRSISTRIIEYQRLYCTPSPSRVRDYHADLNSIKILNRSIEYYESSLYTTDFRKGFVLAMQSFLLFIYRMNAIAEGYELYAILANYGITANMLEALELTNVVEAFILANADTDAPAIEASASDSSQHLPSGQTPYLAGVQV